MPEQQTTSNEKEPVDLFEGVFISGNGSEQHPYETRAAYPDDYLVTNVRKLLAIVGGSVWVTWGTIKIHIGLRDKDFSLVILGKDTLNKEVPYQEQYLKSVEEAIESMNESDHSQEESQTLTLQKRIIGFLTGSRDRKQG